MNLVGLFLENSKERDYLGLFSFIVLSYIIAPFQAFAAVKGFLEKEEGPWFRTPKTGRITDNFMPGRISCFIKGILGKPALSPDMNLSVFSENPYLALYSANNGFNAKILRRRNGVRWQSKSVLAVFLIVTTMLNYLALFPLAPKSQAAWYNSNYTYKKQITINHTLVNTTGESTSNLTNFPVLISNSDAALCDKNHSGYVQNTSGYDIIFVDSTETTQLDHEIELYDGTEATATNCKIAMWVRIPALSSVSDTVIYMYYDNSSISTSQENISGVGKTWDSNYKGVWHLKETSGNQVDSTNNTNNLTAINVSAQGSAVGMIDGADSFTTKGSGRNAQAANSTSLKPVNITVEAWVNLTMNSTAQNIAMKTHAVAPWYSYRLSVTSGNKAEFAWVRSNSNEYDADGATTLSPSTWYFLAGTYNNTNNKIFSYVNGANDSGSGNTTGGSAISSNSTFYIGDDNVANSPDGIIDEVRLSSTVRTIGWLTTEYNNGNSPPGFETFGSATQVPENLLLMIPFMFFLPKIIESLKKQRKLRLATRQHAVVNSKISSFARKKTTRATKECFPDPAHARLFLKQHIAKVKGA